jgi:hypothetical protein
MWSNFFVINTLMRKEVLQRQDFPLGDETYTGPLVKAEHTAPFDLAAPHPPAPREWAVGGGQRAAAPHPSPPSPAFGEGKLSPTAARPRSPLPAAHFRGPPERGQG